MKMEENKNVGVYFQIALNLFELQRNWAKSMILSVFCFLSLCDTDFGSSYGSLSLLLALHFDANGYVKHC